MQQKINEMQAKYDEFCEILPQLEADLVRFKRAAALIRDLEHFATEDFLTFYEAIEAGESVDLRTNGQLSVMNEDAIWQAYGDFQRLNVARLKAAVAVLEHESD